MCSIMNLVGKKPFAVMSDLFDLLGQEGCWRVKRRERGSWKQGM